jgi:hypothetical protein
MTPREEWLDDLRPRVPPNRRQLLMEFLYGLIADAACDGVDAKQIMAEAFLTVTIGVVVATNISDRDGLDRLYERGVNVGLEIADELAKEEKIS